MTQNGKETVKFSAPPGSVRHPLRATLAWPADQFFVSFAAFCDHVSQREFLEWGIKLVADLGGQICVHLRPSVVALVAFVRSAHHFLRAPSEF
jgi:hypothetical protein